jgi:DNA recombination protein RmuC
MNTKLREVEALPGEQTEGLLGDAYASLQEPDA